MDSVWLVEVEKLDPDCNTYLEFDSLWCSHEKALEYAKEEFSQKNWASPVPGFEITQVKIRGLTCKN